MQSGKRRRWVIAAVVVAAVLLLVAVPGYLSTRPEFYRRYTPLGEEYKTWSTSTHAETGCERCHVPPAFFPQVAYRARMLGEFYVSLVSNDRIPKGLDSPTDDACLSCHADLRTVSPKGDLQIPHKAHVTILKMKCVECHGYLVHEKSPEGKHTPSMGGCMRCHDGDTAKNNCTACHTAKAAPDSHRAADWTIVHAQKGNDPECAECHAWIEDWCVDCHKRRPRSHTANWRETHRDRIAEHRSCEACHEGEFCKRCHGEVPAANLNPALKLVQ